MRRTKIVCTIGPSIDTEEQIAGIINAGMDVARLNLSHGTREDHYRRLKLIRKVAAEQKRNVGFLVDTRGPEVRTGTLIEDSVTLVEGETFTLTTEEVTGDKKRVSVTYPRLHEDIKAGSTILIDDGLLVLEVTAVEGRDIICRVVHGGALKSYKGLNMPGSKISLPAVGEEDRTDIKLALEQEVHFIAASFIRNAADVFEVRALVEDYCGRAIIISKIECREGVENFDEILDVSDGIMVARGDLGVEIPTEEVPMLQKAFIRKCNRAGKPVITATQMLDSMIRNPRPTRAEASDVANAIFDGSDAVMLSGETAVGRFPIEAVETMSRIARFAEANLDYDRILEEHGNRMEKTVTDAISYATCHTAHELGADAIITSTQSGHTARMVAKYRPKAPIMAVSSSRYVAGQLTLTWGVTAAPSPPVDDTDSMFRNAIQTAINENMVQQGNLVVITAGVPANVSGTTNLLRVETVGEVIVKGTGIGKKAVSGIAHVIHCPGDLDSFPEGGILVSKITNSRYTEALEKSTGLICEEGGLTSHGAIVALNLKKPAVVGVNNATGVIESGELITVDATRGLVYRGDVKVL